MAGVLGTAAPGIYELGGPDVATFRDLMRDMLAVIQRRRLVLGLPVWVGNLMATGFGALQVLSGGLIENKMITRDQVKLLAHDNVVATGAKGLADLGIAATPYGAVLPEYLWRYRPAGQYAAIKNSAKQMRKS